MKITFDNIAGYGAEVKEVKSICAMINNYEEFKKIGVTLPKGLLLYGNPGVGKTLFAQAIASEIKREFVDVSITGLEEDNINTILKTKFKEAEEKAPSVLFIDELDKIVPSRAGGNPFYSDYSRQTLQLLLSLLDGFTSNHDVMVICTANSLESMPDSLTRAGRIDKHIYLTLPNEESRTAISEYYLKQVKYNKDIDLAQFVLSTEGLSGADIKTVINEAAIETINKKEQAIKTAELIEHISRLEGKSLVDALKEEDAIIVAYHELGHFIVANELKKVVHDINIHKMHQQLGRVRYQISSDVMTTEDIINDVTIALGGRAAEIIFTNKKYVGSWQDIQKSYSMLEQAFTHGDFGFEHLIFNGSHIRAREAIREQVIEIINKCLAKAQEIVQNNSSIIKELHPLLVEKKILTAADLKKHFQGTVIEKKDEQYAYDDFADGYIEI